MYFTPKCHRLVWVLSKNRELWEKDLQCCQGQAATSRRWQSKRYEAWMIWNDVLTCSIRWAEDLPAAGVEEESDGVQWRPSWISKALTLVWLHQQGFTNSLIGCKCCQNVQMCCSEEQDIFNNNAAQETFYSPSRWSKTKRSCYRRFPAIFKSTTSPARGLQLSPFTIIQTIGVPVAIVAADVATDGKLLFDFSSYIDTLRANNTSSDTTYMTMWQSYITVPIQGAKKSMYFAVCLLRRASSSPSPCYTWSWETR